jgi:hypothetical protein
MITLSHAMAISRSKMDILQSDFAKRVHDWLEACVANNLVPYIYEGIRSSQRQNDLFRIGRRGVQDELVVTNAKAGQSFHQYGLAVDWVPLIRHPKADGMYETAWNTPMEKELFRKGQMIAERFNLRRLTWEDEHLEDGRFKDWHELADKFPIQ